jgi:hypothetical protein
MLGGINNSMFFQALGGFLILPLFILFLKWTFPSKKDHAGIARRKEIKRSLRELKRK